MNAELDFVFNGQASGAVANRLLASGGDPTMLRPFIGRDGRAWVTTNGADGKPCARPITNATATLRKDEWIQLDQAVLKVARSRLKLVADLRSSGLTYNIPNGMAKTVLQHQTQSDMSPAIASMDGLRQSQRDRPLYDLTNLPLPIIHKDFSFSMREILASRSGANGIGTGGSPLDTTGAEIAARKVAEAAEQLAIGSFGTYQFGGGNVYGLLNFPQRLTQSMTLPTATAWVPSTTVSDVMSMRQKSQNAKYYGPWILYTSLAWDKYLDLDYSTTTAQALTLRNRLKMIDGIQDVRTLDYLDENGGYVMMLVQQSTEVIREVIGMDVTTVQWETEGGMLQNFKVMCILVPQLRADFNSNTGIVHGS